MSSSPFSVDMETMEGHVPSTSEFITPRISGKQHPQQFQPNGLTGINELDVNTQKDKKMNVIVYCQPAKSSAEILQDEIQQGGHSASLLCLTEPKDLKEKIQLESVRDLYMMADSSLFELLFQKRHHRGFHSDVNDFMDELEDNKKCISLFNRMEEGDNRFMKLLNQFPTNCARKMERASISIDSGIADLSLNESSSQDSGGEAADSINKLKESSSSDNIKTGPGGDGREIYYSEKNACLMSSTPEGLIASPGNAESYSEESPGGEAEVKSKDEGALKLTEDESLSEDFEEEPQSNVDVHAVQIGNNNTMELLWTGSWMVSASQDGWNNTMGVKIVPPASKSNVNVTLTKNPRDEKLENLLVKVFNEESELVNIRVENLDASNVTFSRGSIVMEIEVKPGVTINKQYIEKLMNVIFSGKAGKVIPEGTKFDVDIQTKMVIPVDQLGKYVHLNPEKIHENCVSKEKYEEKVKEIQELQSRLVQGILKNPKQDQVLQSALKNFISSVLTDFAFAMATEIPALQVSGSRRQEATAREEERNPVVSGLNTTREHECVVQGLSRQADSKYNEITHTKGPRLIKEQSNPEPSSTEITTRHSKWRFDVLIIRGNKAFLLESLSELLTKNGFKCEKISFGELHKDHHMLKSSKYVVYHDDGWHFDKELFEMISFHHKRVICLYYEGFPLLNRHHLLQDMVLTFINMNGEFWREDLFDQLGRREHQTQRETTFDDELTEKTHQLFDSVYGFGKNRPDFLVKHDGPEVSIQWTQQTQQKAVLQTGRGRQEPGVSWKQRIVILHSHADEDIASTLNNHLVKKKGYICSLHSDLNVKSQDIEKSSIIIILVSEKFLENEYLMLMRTIHKEGKKQIIPVVLDNASVPQSLQSFKKVVVGEKIWQEKLTDLLEDAEKKQQFLRESTYDGKQLLDSSTVDFGRYGDRLQAYSDADSFVTPRNIYVPSVQQIYHQPLRLYSQDADSFVTPRNIYVPSVQQIYHQPLPLYSQVFEGMSTQNLKSSEQIIEESFPKVFSGLYDEVPSFTVQKKGDTITINWTEENLKRKLYTMGSQEVGEASGMRKTDKGETTGMRRAEQGERTGMRKTGAEGEKEYAGATKLAQKEEKHTVNLEEVLESYAREGKKYEDFREAVHKSLGSESSWRTIASVLYATKNVMSRLGTTIAAPLRQLAEKFVQEECADFIIQQGGWEAVLDEECSDLESD